MAVEKLGHKWRFFRAGDFEQVRLDRTEDLCALRQLDQKLWVALACPTDGLELDKKTLELIDTDRDGRIRAPELLTAVDWACEVLADPSDLTDGSAKLPLKAIDAKNAEGKRLLASARQILLDLGKPDAEHITLDDTADTAKIFAATKFNGDGVVPATSTDDEVTGKVIEDIVTCLGGAPDRSGKVGVTQAKLDEFFTEAAAFSAWWQTAEASASTIMPLGDATADAAALVARLKPKVDDYFARCRLVAFDPRAAGPLNGLESDYAALASKVLSPEAEAIAALPLAKIEAEKPLPLFTGLNPAWADAVKKLQQDVVSPLLGSKHNLSEHDWQALLGKLAPYEAWRAQTAGGTVAKLGLPRVREILAGDARARIGELIAKDNALEPEAASIAAVEKLIRFHRDLYTLLTNFVSFRSFYAREKAVFQAGTLYLDRRGCDLCIKVADVDAHAALAARSGTYLAYCELNRKATGEKMIVAAAFTGGDSDELSVGRNGIFYDRQGRDWDATIVRLVEHPISVRQAFWLPYKRIGKLISEQIQKFASARDKEMHDKAAAGVSSTATAATGAPAAPAAPPAPEPPFDIARFVGVFAGIGIALGAIGSVLLAIASGFLSLRVWQMPLAILGVILAISFPSMLIAHLKLRERNIGPILNATGWAVNARVKMNLPFGGSLTSQASLPRNAERSFRDPFAEKRRPWGLYLLIVLLIAGVVAWKLGYAATWAKQVAPALRLPLSSSAR